ncbi:MAG: DAK2 domain-containing protein [Actinomycetota bacterium]|nr:DAK2 domain-containing protein [Actinomycetota bacterium]
MEGTTQKREGAVTKAAANADVSVASNLDLKTVIVAAHATLAVHAERINALNVYPVPDGDTGTNMLLTLRSVLDEVSGSPELSREEAARAVSRAALMGARGNSGVILSQILRGACGVLGESETLDAAAVVAALQGASERAYATVRQPVEGTMLSVIKDVAAVAADLADRGEKDPLEVLRMAAREAHASVQRTPELLSVLKEAGVVDAGGLGIAVILDGIVSGLSGEAPAQDLPEAETVAVGERMRKTVEHSAEEAWGYCTEFIVTGFRGDEGEFETRIREMGKSVLVVPDGDLVKVHLHTQDPGGALTYAGGFGRLSGVKADDMEAQTRARAGEGGPAAPTGAAAKLAVVAASRGVGNRAFFESMGAVVVEGGQGANPSAQDFVRAVERTGADAVILLPNNKNVVPTAEQVGELSGTVVHVVPTTSIAGGLAVMIGYDAEEEAPDVVEEMREISVGLRCGEVTRAVRTATIAGREVPEGAYIGLLDGELVAVEDGVEDAAIRLVEKILEQGADIVTLLRGYGMDERSAGKVAERIKLLDGAVEVEVRDGGQPLYPLQVVAE